MVNYPCTSSYLCSSQTLINITYDKDDINTHYLVESFNNQHIHYSGLLRDGSPRFCWVSVHLSRSIGVLYSRYLFKEFSVDNSLARYVRRQICLISVTSLSGTKFGQVCLEPIIRVL